MDARYPGVEFSQFTGAEMMARKYDLSRDELDAYSYESHRKAMAATQAGSFDDEIVPLEV
jgi:acetyl-CoA C-acetyltransferase